MGNDFILEKAKPFKKGWDAAYRHFTTRTLFDKSIAPIMSMSIRLLDDIALEKGDVLSGVLHNGEVIVGRKGRVIECLKNPPQALIEELRKSGALILEVDTVHNLSRRADVIVHQPPREPA